MENSYQQQQHYHSQQQQQQQFPGSQMSSSTSSNSISSSSSSSSSTSSQEDLSNITISAGYWNTNKYSAFDLVRQQSLETQGQTSLGWSQTIAKKWKWWKIILLTVIGWFIVRVGRYLNYVKIYSCVCVCHKNRISLLLFVLRYHQCLPIFWKYLWI